MSQDNVEVEETVQVEESPVMETEEDESQYNVAVDLLKRNPTTLEDVNAIRAAVFKSPQHWMKLEHFVCDVLKEGDADFEQKQAIGLAVLGMYDKAESKLEAIRETPVAACLLGRIYQETSRTREAIEIFKKVHKRVPEVSLYLALLAEAYEIADDLDGFRRELESLEAIAPKDSQTIYLKGLSNERDGEYDDAKENYIRAIDSNPENVSALFRLAYRLDLEGRDDDARDFYQRCVTQGISNLAALTNLGLLYDDEERYDEASKCFEMVTIVYPRNERAKRYLRDAEASKTMYYDEEKERKEDKQAQILRIPVTDFELSVRSRNCLSKMNIRSLGDLIKKTEAELLAFKNFGETSLQEIKQILNSKGLRLGMVLTESDELGNILEPAADDTDSDSVMGKPLDELDLSVRSRNCLALLQIKTLGQLADCTEPQLVACKNFGQTSLNEIRKKLNDYGLTLKS